MHADFETDTDLDSFPIAMPRLVKTVRESVPDHDTIVCLDNGLYKVRCVSGTVSASCSVYAVYGVCYLRCRTTIVCLDNGLHKLQFVLRYGTVYGMYGLTKKQCVC